ncbi:MAG: hypothetical protein WA705_28270 [Candidatus Ozemobacteraceae bacterium]
MKKRLSGFTLIEIILVVFCVALLLGPLWAILRSGTRTSLRGMTKIETTMEARRILAIVQQDIKAGYAPINQEIEDFIRQVSDSNNVYSYVFQSFSRTGSEGESLVKNDGGIDFRLINLLEYRVEPGENGINGKLKRIERFDSHHPLAGKFPNGLEKTLSERVSYFSIRRRSVGKEAGDSVWYINLVLADGHLAKANTGTPNSSIEPGPTLVMADFFDVAYPEFVHANFTYPSLYRNWHNSFVGPQP